MSDLTITRNQYDALIAAALDKNTSEVLRLRSIIDKQNDIKRYFLNVRWQDVGGEPPPRVSFSAGWPPMSTYKIELERKIVRSDVEDVLRTQAANPQLVLVTPDPNAEVGWTEIDEYDFATGG